MSSIACRIDEQKCSGLGADAVSVRAAEGVHHVNTTEPKTTDSDSTTAVPAAELFSEERSVDVVNASFDTTADPRLHEIMTSLVRHLHAFVKDVELTVAEA